MIQTASSAAKQNQIRKNTIHGINALLVLLSLFAVLKSIFISFDIDEGYAIAQSYRLATGSRLLTEMWEPHQFSAFFSAIFMLPFLAVTGGDTTGIVIYLRVIGSLIHLLIGVGFFIAARKQFNTSVGLLIALIHMNFLPKWVSSPEFEIQHYWSVCVIFLALYFWNRSKQHNGFLLLASVALWIAIMSYPTMVILYPVYIVAIASCTKKDRKRIGSAIIWFTLPMLVIGVAFIGYLFSYMTLPELLENLSCILMDESHSVSLAQRCKEYFYEIADFAGQLLLYLAGSFMITICIRKYFSLKGKDCLSSPKEKIPVLLLLAILLLSVNHMVSSLLGDTNQFYLYFRFLVIVLFGFLCFLLSKEETREYFYFGIVPGIFSVLASAAITNMTFEIALARIYIAVIATCFIAASLLLTSYRQDRLFQGLMYGTAVLFLLSLLVCKLLLVRVTGCIPISVKMHMTPVTSGPAAGLLLKEELAQTYNENTAFIRDNVADTDKLLYFGCENIYYLVTNADIATPSTQGTSVFNEMYLAYYEKHPEKLPNVVILDKSFETNPEYNYSMQNHTIVLDWILEEFADAKKLETDNLILLRR